MVTDQQGGPPRTPAGWYPDPDNPGQSRYWDGVLWAPPQPQAPPDPVGQAATALPRTPKTGFWANPVVVVLALLIFFPAGLFLMWRNRLWNKPARWVITAAVAILVVVIGSQPTPTTPTANTGGTTQPSPTATASTQPTTVAVPSLVGTSEASVSAALTASGLKLGQTTHVPSPTPAGTVITQQPPRGTQVTPGTVVTIIVSSGPQTTPTHAVPTPSAAPTHSASPKPTTVALSCSAGMSNRTPSQNSTTYVLVRTAGGASVTATAHYKTTDTSHSVTASASGRASLAFRISRATVGFTVVVDVTVSKAGHAASCSTSFVPH